MIGAPEGGVAATKATAAIASEGADRQHLHGDRGDRGGGDDGRGRGRVRDRAQRPGAIRGDDLGAERGAARARRLPRGARFHAADATTRV